MAAGADGIFVPALAEDTDIAEVVAEVAVPVNILFLPHRHTLRGLAALGVRRVSTGSLLFRAAVHAAVSTAEAIRDGLPTGAGVPGYARFQQLVAEPLPENPGGRSAAG